MVITKTIKLNTIMKKILLLSALFLYAGLTAQAQQITGFEQVTRPSGMIYAYCNEYTNNLYHIWNVDIGQNKKVKVNYAINTEANYDKIEVYSINTSGAIKLLFSESGQKSGLIYSEFPTGKIQVLFKTDESVSCSGTQYSGFELSFRADDRTILDGPISGYHGYYGGTLQVITNYGYLDLGPKSTTEAHLSTDRSRFLLNKPLFLQTGTLSAYNTSNMYFQTNGTSRMTILNTNGNVGIGTTAPTQKLEVQGNAYLTGNMSIGEAVKTDTKLNIYHNTSSSSAIYGLRSVVSSGSAPTYGSGSVYGAYLSATAGNDNASAYGLYISAANYSSTAKTYGIYTSVMNGWAAYFSGGKVAVTGNLGVGIGDPTQKLDVRGNAYLSGNVGIGVSNPTQKLEVNGTIKAKEVKIDINTGADFVFSPEYNLKSLSDVESFIQTNKHLPEIPSEKAMQEEGLSINEFQIKLLQKIEELTLYAIEQNKKIEKMEKELKELKETR